MAKWRDYFQELLSSSSVAGVHYENNYIPDEENNDSGINESISLGEVKRAVQRLKKGKAFGYDGIPSEILTSERCVEFLHKLFNKCFESGKVPAMWANGIINPIQKASCADAKDPANYRGITLTSAVYKVFAGILNERLTNWAEENGIISDYQNGFRKSRSTVDHISTLTNIIECRKMEKKPTFICFVDFQKAYDSINRRLLWDKLSDIGLKGKIIRSLKAIYNDVKCSVRINGHYSDWFSVESGVKQGCLLSPMIFNLFLNDLSNAIEQTGLGVDIQGTRIGMLCYADDLAVMAESEEDLQHLLGVLSEWCQLNQMDINADKTKVVHFRTPSTDRSHCSFKIGLHDILISGSYKYLGLLLDEFLNYETTASFVAKSASRALGLVISKFKSAGGLSYNVFTKLYDSYVWSTISYGASIWGTKEFSCINAVQNRACRFFLGVGKYTPNNGVNGDMGWKPPIIKQWKCVLRLESRFKNMDNRRLNRHVYEWMCNKRGKHWKFRLNKQLEQYGIDQDDANVSRALESCMFQKHKDDWRIKINEESGSRPNQRNKLRTYKMFKNDYGAESYVTSVISRSHRSALAKFRCGVAPLRIETGRYERLPPGERSCFNCANLIEDELHVLIRCPLYQDLREELFIKAISIEQSFDGLTDVQKMCFIMSNKEIVKYTAKTCNDILTRRRSLFYNTGR